MATVVVVVVVVVVLVVVVDVVVGLDVELMLWLYAAVIRVVGVSMAEGVVIVDRVAGRTVERRAGRAGPVAFS